MKFCTKIAITIFMISGITEASQRSEPAICDHIYAADSLAAGLKPGSLSSDAAGPNLDKIKNNLDLKEANTDYLVPTPTLLNILEIDQGDIQVSKDTIRLVVTVMLKAPLYNEEIRSIREKNWIMEQPRFLNEQLTLIKHRGNLAETKIQEEKIMSLLKDLRREFREADAKSLSIYKDDLTFVESQLTELVKDTKDHASLLYPVLSRLDAAIVKRDFHSAMMFP